MARTVEINPQDVQNIIKELGYEIVRQDRPDLFWIQGSSGIRIVCGVENEILNVTVPLVTVDEAAITRDIALAMLWADNGLATSHVELVRAGNKVRVVLMNYCKLQELGDDDRDDIETALEFCELDTVKARDILSDLVA